VNIQILQFVSAIRNQFEGSAIFCMQIILRLFKSFCYGRMLGDVQPLL
jgi:hypothetical protein